MTERLTTRNPGPIAKKLLARESFNTNGALKGVAKPSWFDHGKISVRDFCTLQSDKQAYGIDYVIYSYDTPIAWLFNKNGGSWAMPDAKYSVTTSKHQTTIRAAIKEFNRALGR